MPLSRAPTPSATSNNGEYGMSAECGQPDADVTNSEELWDLPDAAGYIAVSITKCANDCEWPDDLRGNAARFLVQDLGEFGQAMVACGRATFWSPAKAMQRLFIERIEVLMGATVDSSVAKRFLDSVVVPPEIGKGNRPVKKARGEDALASYFHSVPVPAEGVDTYRKAWVTTKSIGSEWFVHPTAMGPLLSHQIQTGEIGAEASWSELIPLLGMGCFWTIAAASQLTVTLHPEIVRSLYAAGKCLEQVGSPVGSTLLQMHDGIAQRLSVDRAEG